MTKHEGNALNISTIKENVNILNSYTYLVINSLIACAYTVIYPLTREQSVIVLSRQSLLTTAANYYQYLLVDTSNHKPNYTV